MSIIQEPAIPLFEEVVNGYHKLSTSGEGSESSELSRARKSAFEKFKLAGFPSIRNEDWKYTNINKFLKEEYVLSGVAGERGVAASGVSGNGHDLLGSRIRELLVKATIPGLDCYQVVLVNGVWDGIVIGGPLPKGLELYKVADVLKDPRFSVHFENAKWGNQSFANLNTALFTDGLFLTVKGSVADKPLHIVHLYTSDRNLFVQPRHVWVSQPNAELSVIESVLSDAGVSGDGGSVGDAGTSGDKGIAGNAGISGDGGSVGVRGSGDSGTPGEAGRASVWVNSLTEIIADKDSRIDHVVLQTASAGLRLVNHTTARQKKQSLYNNYTFTLPGAELVRNDLQARLEEDHTETHLYGLYLAAGGQLIDNHTLVDHQKPHCFSNELYKGVLLEQSTGVFNGKVYVHKDAQKTNAFQQNNNLVISKKATIDSKPELEIFADDVKCSHGSTVGQFSEEALFYLRARGLGEATAKAMLIAAFAFDVTEKIKNKAVESYVNELISYHIPV